MYKSRLSHKSFPEQCNDGTELSASIWLCDLSAYKIISTEPHDSGSLLLTPYSHSMEATSSYTGEPTREIGTFMTGSFCPVCKAWWDGTNTGPDKYSLEPHYVHES